jgi:putative FmdB family regulatory protein
MPLYEYQCQECAETLEIVQRFSDEPQTICPSCGGVLKKLISSPAIRFKGSGFYLTDYGKGTSGPAARAAEGNGGGEAASAGSESSPAPSDSTRSDSAKTDSTKADSAKPDAPKSSPVSRGSSTTGDTGS